MSENETRSFTADVNINKFKLDEECAKQPSLYHFWSEKLANAKAAVNDATDKLKLTESERELAYRSMTELPGGVKSTEASIKSCVETDGAVKAAKQELREAQAVQYKLEAGVRALDHRKSELDNLTQLYIKNYYSRPDGAPGSANDTASADLRKNLNKDKGDN